MNFYIVGIFVSVFLAFLGGISAIIWGLTNKYFKAIEARITKLEDNQQVFQSQMLVSVQSIEKAMIKLESGENKYATTDNCIINNRRSDEKVETLKKELMATIVELEKRLVIQINGYGAKLDKHLEHGRNNV